MSVSNQEDKTDNNDDGLQDLGIPVPIQTFLWGQIAPFIRPKLGKLHEAACMVCHFVSFTFKDIIDLYFFLVLSTCARPLRIERSL